MALDTGILQRLTQGTAADAWRFLIERTLEIAAKPLAAAFFKLVVALTVFLCHFLLLLWPPIRVERNRANCLPISGLA